MNISLVFVCVFYLDKHSFPHKTKASAAATTSHTTTSNKPAVTTFTSSSPTSSNVASNKVPGSSQTAVKKLGQGTWCTIRT